MLAMKSRLCSALVVALIALVLVGCATPIDTNNLALGMTSSEVEAAIQKKPLLTWAQDGKIRKVYGSTLYGYMHVDFIDDKAIGWGNGGGDFNSVDPIEIESDSTTEFENGY